MLTALIQVVVSRLGLVPAVNPAPLTSGWVDDVTPDWVASDMMRVQRTTGKVAAVGQVRVSLTERQSSDHSRDRTDCRRCRLDVQAMAPLPHRHKIRLGGRSA